MITPSDQAPIFPHMITCASATDHVAGMGQATPGLGDQWKNLSKANQPQLLTHWEKAFHNSPSKAAATIIASIASHPQLSHPCHELTQEVCDSKSTSIEAIARNILLENIASPSPPSPSFSTAQSSEPAQSNSDNT